MQIPLLLVCIFHTRVTSNISQTTIPHPDQPPHANPPSHLSGAQKGAHPANWTAPDTSYFICHSSYFHSCTFLALFTIVFLFTPKATSQSHQRSTDSPYLDSLCLSIPSSLDQQGTRSLFPCRRGNQLPIAGCP